jgi:hypothetical protein
MNFDTYLEALAGHLCDKYGCDETGAAFVDVPILRDALNDLGLTLVPAEEPPRPT